MKNPTYAFSVRSLVWLLCGISATLAVNSARAQTEPQSPAPQAVVAPQLGAADPAEAPATPVAATAAPVPEAAAPVAVPAAPNAQPGVVTSPSATLSVSELHADGAEADVVAPETPAEFAAEPEKAQFPVDADNMEFKPGKGFHVESEEGDFGLTTRTRAQLLYELRHTDKYAQDMQIRRARLQMEGKFFGENNRFKVELAVSPRDVGMSSGGTPETSPLLDYYFDFTHLRDLSLRVGQYKVPFNRQRVVSSGDLRFVDRSIVNSEFNVDRDLGFDIRSADFLGLDMLRYYAGVYVGEGRNTFRQADFGMMYLARVEVLPFGDFNDYKEADLERVDAPKLSVGFGYGYLDRAPHERGILGDELENGTLDMHLLNADAVFRLSGFSLETEFIYRSAKYNSNGPGGAVLPRDGFGWMAQVGYLIPCTDFEVAARAGMVRSTNAESVMADLGDADSSLGDENEYGVALNYYFGGHPFKLQLDYFRLGERAAGASTYAWEDQVRLQLQAGL